MTFSAAIWVIRVGCVKHIGLRMNMVKLIYRLWNFEDSAAVAEELRPRKGDGCRSGSYRAGSSSNNSMRGNIWLSERQLLPESHMVSAYWCVLGYMIRAMSFLWWM